MTREWKVEEKAYVAGLLDGDGYISIGKTTCSPYVSYSLIIGIHSVDKKTLDALQSYFNLGSVRRQKKSKNGKNIRPLWKWELRTKEALFLLEKIHPYLKMKKEQSKFGMEFALSKKPYGCKGTPKKRIEISGKFKI